MKFHKSLLFVLYIFRVVGLSSSPGFCRCNVVDVEEPSPVLVSEFIITAAPGDIEAEKKSFQYAYFSGDFAALKILLERTLDKDALLFSKTELGFTVLLKAVLDVNLSVVELMRKNISSLQKWRELLCLQNNWGQSPASVAYNHSNEEIKQILFGTVIKPGETLEFFMTWLTNAELP
jgi:hypothetical protein